MMTQEAQNQWYVLRGDDKYGPFDYRAMIGLLQKNELYDYSYVWASHLDGWTPLGELADFSRDRLARLIENNAEIKSAFTPRAFPRVDVRIPVYGHNDELFFDGATLSVSENGALLLLNSPLLMPGEDLMIHVRGLDSNVVPFNARGTIVRKNFTRARLNVKSGLHYAVRFGEVSPVGRRVLHQIVQQFSKEGKQ